MKPKRKRDTMLREAERRLKRGGPRVTLEQVECRIAARAERKVRTASAAPAHLAPVAVMLARRSGLRSRSGCFGGVGSPQGEAG